MSLSSQIHQEGNLITGDNGEPSFQLQNIIEPRALCHSTMKQFMQSEDWGLQYATFMKEGTRSRIHLQHCEINGCEGLCELPLKMGHSAFWELLSDVETEVRQEASEQSPSGSDLTQGQVPAPMKESNEGHTSSELQPGASFFDNYYTLSDGKQANETESVHQKTSQQLELHEVPVPSTSTNSQPTDYVVPVSNKNPPILGTTKYKIPEVLTQSAIWLTAKNSLLSMKQNKKDDQSIATELGKLFYDGIFTKEEQLNCFQRKQKVPKGNKETRAFDPIKKEFVFSATAFCIKNPAAAALDFLFALNTTSADLQLAKDIRIYLHTRIFSKHASDVRKKLVENQQQ